MSVKLQRHGPNSIGLIGHAIIGYPNLDITRQFVQILVEQGVELIELQIPFSEPIADGPLFTRANFAALSQGITVDDCFAFMQEMSSTYAIPFVFMTYANIVFVRGFKQFVQKAKQSGAQGAIVPDLPFDVAKEYLTACREYDFSAIQIIPPNASTLRIQQLCQASDGFIYAVARAGVTGEKTALDKPVIEFITRIREHTDLPIALGFGISCKEDIDFLKPYADYAVIGTQSLRVFEKNGLQAVADFWQQLNAQ